MSYMLDTNICVFMLNQEPGVLHRFQAAMSDGVCISVITLAELEYGVSKSARKEHNTSALAAFLALVDVLPFDIPATGEYGQIRATLARAGHVIGSLDMLIAAHAKSENLTLVTNNTREFKRVDGLRLEDWR
ncbi:MAG: type II toxin-antitoxin system VapC family toxin [Clostridiales bacterium]|jgi:tRNA(fMet)-specific endonuclease VapC|nr:type II toxin-antitoxin system VapC family toxin [Clostridiales bacterium]